MDEMRTMDMRTLTFNVLPQEILTKDSVTIRVDAVVFFKIKDPFLACCKVTNYAYSTKLLASTTLRNTLGTKTLTAVLAERDQIAQDIKTSLDAATDPWGIQVHIIRHYITE